jgi:hypothetical protein
MEWGIFLSLSLALVLLPLMLFRPPASNDASKKKKQ